MIAYQQKGGQNGINLKHRVRKHLEGWDFIHATTRQELHGRVATLDQAADGWVEFACSISAVTLFGKGFGDIIESIKVCSLWCAVLIGKYYLAAIVFDLKKIQRERITAHPPLSLSLNGSVLHFRLRNACAHAGNLGKTIDLSSPGFPLSDLGYLAIEKKEISRPSELKDGDGILNKSGERTDPNLSGGITCNL
ncbi:hypothetical protein F5Y12DRAFT_322363 [Xylaria sp. FL1777]|nr:hypothetical protein F5Y12DRAFT_322363 [Xylaria sp. FL1777]